MPPFDCVTDFIFAETGIEKSDVILIPGGSRPQLMEKAAALHHGRYAPLILPSGGPNPKIPCHPSEWAYLRKIAIELGIPREVILKEDRARNTFENARLSWEVLRSSNIPVKKAILVCKAHHARRALLTYQSVFPCETIFYIAPVIDDRGISRDTWFLSQEHIHIVMSEVGKIGRYLEDKFSRWVEQ